MIEIIESRRWTTERDDALRAFWADPKMSASKIAARMGLSKSAILGRVHRLGLPKRTPGWPKREGTSSPKAKRAPRKPVVIGAHQCRFPLWGDEEAPTHEYCQSKAIEGRSYCPEHHDRCYVPVDRNKKAPDGGFDWLVKRVA
jgi:GcrA cell cycle regulator